MKLISLKSCALWVTLKIKRPHICTQPTQFKILSKVFKAEFPGNWTKFLISQDSARFTKSVPIIGNRKILCNKKVKTILNLGIHITIIIYKLTISNDLNDFRIGQFFRENPVDQ